MVKQNTESPSENREPLHPLLENQEQMRRTLGLDERYAKEWEGVIKDFMEDVPHPDKAPGATAERKSALAERYLELGERRDKVANGLLYLEQLGRDPNKPALSDDMKNGILLGLAWYYKDLLSYRNAYEGKSDPRLDDLPGFLALHLDLSPEATAVMGNMERILPLQYDVQESTGLSRSPIEMTASAQAILRSMITHNLHLDALMKDGAFIDAKEDHEAMLRSLNLSVIDAQSVEASRFLTAFMAKCKGQIEKYAKVRGKRVEDLQMIEAMEACSPLGDVMQMANQIVVQATVVQDGGMPDVGEFAKSLFEKTGSYSVVPLTIALAPFLDSEAKKASPEENERDIKELLSYFMGEKALAFVSERQTFLNGITGRPKAMAAFILDDICRDETVTAMMRACHIPEANDPVLEADVRARLSEIVTGQQLTTRDAFELFYFKSNETGGSTAMSFKTVEMLERTGPYKLCARVQSVMFRFYGDLAMQAARDVDISAVVDKMQLTPEQKREIENVSKYTLDKGLKEIEKGVAKVEANLERNKDILAKVGITIGVAGIPVGYYWYKMGAPARFLQMKPDQLRAVFGDGPEFKRAQQAQAELIKLQARYSLLKDRIRPVQWYNKLWTMRREKWRIYKAGNAEKLSEYARHMKKVYPDARDLAPALDEAGAQPHEVRATLQELGYSEADVDAGMKSMAETRVSNGKFPVAEMVPDERTPLEKAKDRSGTGAVGDALDPASVARDTARVSPDSAARTPADADKNPVAGDETPDTTKKSALPDWIRKRLGKKK